MSNYEQNPPAQVSHYPQAKVDYGGTGKDFVAPTPLPAPPVPVGHPVKDGYETNDQNPPHGSQSRGHGFWRGCCAGMCCCCLLDACF